LSRTTLLLIHILNPDILFSVVSCCAHGDCRSPICVPPIRLAHNSAESHFSRATTVFTKALSIADMTLTSTFQL
jgi:hypothetical protein